MKRSQHLILAAEQAYLLTNRGTLLPIDLSHLSFVSVRFVLGPGCQLTFQIALLHLIFTDDFSFTVTPTNLKPMM